MGTAYLDKTIAAANAVLTAFSQGQSVMGRIQRWVGYVRPVWGLVANVKDSFLTRTQTVIKLSNVLREIGQRKGKLQQWTQSFDLKLTASDQQLLDSVSRIISTMNEDRRAAGHTDEISQLTEPRSVVT